MTNIIMPYGAGTAAREKGEAPGRDESAEGLREQGNADNFESRRALLAGRALRMEQGEGNATAEHPARLHVEQTGLDDLALIVGMLCGATLSGFASAIDTAPRGAA